MNKVALVVSGGGSRGAFAVGAIEELRKAGIQFDLVSGTSTGALIAPLVTIDDLATLRYIYSSVSTSDILRQRSIPEILFTDSIFDTSPLWSLINSFVDDDRYRKILASRIEMIVTTVNLQTGQIEYFNPKRGPNGAKLDRETLLRAIFASASQPVLMPPVRVPASGDQYVDGGVREVAPLRIAIENGATDIYAIVLSPTNRARESKDYKFVVGTLLRTIDLLLEETSVNDVADARFYNDSLNYLARVRERVSAQLPNMNLDDIFETDLPTNPFSGKKLLNLHVIRPESELPSDGLEFDPIVMSQMMEMGAQTTRAMLTRGASI